MNDVQPVAPAEKVSAPKFNPAPKPAPAPAPTPVRKRTGFGALGIQVAVAAIILGVALYVYIPGLYEEETDDAYVTAHVVTVSPKIPAYVQALHIDDNTAVAAGELLLQLDPRDYQNAVDEAAADLSTAQADVANVNAQLAEQQTIIAQAQAALVSDQAAVTLAGQELQRYSTLVQQSGASVQQLQETQSDVVQKQAGLRHDAAALAQANAHVAVLATHWHRRKAMSLISRRCWPRRG